ncbi:MAG: uroporphyrinogen-III synthase [Myxococcales bacterium]|nr:uroporphyrinogen-III synthase [Myxococcales bacterium]
MVTRPRDRAAGLCALLEKEGARVTALPLLELFPPDDPRPLAQAAAEISRYRWVLFASPKAVEALAEAARVAGTFEQLATVSIAAVGPATARQVRELGLEVAREAATSTGLGLFEMLKGELQPGERVLLPVAQEGRRELHQALEGAGVAVTRVAAYKSEGRPLDGAALDSLEADPPRVVVFGSPKTAEAFLEATGPRGRTILRAAHLVAIGPTTAAALGQLGLAVSAVAERPTSAALVEAVVLAAG